MARLISEAIVILTVLACVFSQQAVKTGQSTPTGSKTFPNPDPSWNEYQFKACCPKGFYEVLNYCVKCTAPNVFDSIDSKCKPCSADQTYSAITGRCECFKCEAPRAMNPATNQCQCKIIKKVQMVYKSDTNECVCPENLPLWNGKYCVACPVGTQYDSKEKQCYNCPQGFIRDKNSHACIPGL